MAYGTTLKINALRRCTGWFPGVYNPSAYAPAVPSDAGTAAMEYVASNSLALVTLAIVLQGYSVLSFHDIHCLLCKEVTAEATSSTQTPPNHREFVPAS